MSGNLIEVEDLRLTLPDLSRKPLFGPAPRVEILKGLSFAVPRGSVTGIVGESGSGKSSLGRVLVRLYRPSSGSVRFDGLDIGRADEAALAPHRRHLQMIFQDTMTALNPRKTIGAIIGGPLRLHRLSDAPGRAAQAALERVGLPGEFVRRYPHELSGGQRQRVGIARAVALAPKFILADEIVSGLDVSSQAQIIALLEGLVAELNLTMAFISHDLSVVRHLCDRLIVMRAGEIVEQGDTAAVFQAPQHPYTRELKAAIPLPVVEPGWLAAP
jgi:ABC-type oligopeptide transport system ATPase subunit